MTCRFEVCTFCIFCHHQNEMFTGKAFSAVLENTKLCINTVIKLTYILLSLPDEKIRIVCLMVCNATFNNISVLTSWRSVLFVEETGGPGENHWQVTDKLCHIMLYNSHWSSFKLTTSVVIGNDCIGSCKSNYHAITAKTTPRIFYIHVLWLYLFCCWISSYQEVEGWDPINLLNTTTFLCLSQARTWITSVICHHFFMFNKLRWEVIVSFVDIGGILDHQSLFKLSFHNLI